VHKKRGRQAIPADDEGTRRPGPDQHRGVGV